MKVPDTVNDSGEVLVRCALLCVGCDLPAGRKVCGFLSHAAGKGCSKCNKVFPGSVSNSICSIDHLDTTIKFFTQRKCCKNYEVHIKN